MIKMKTIEWNVSVLGDDSCVFAISNYNEEDLFDYLHTIQHYILQLGLGDYSVISFSIVEFHNSELKDLEIITDFPFSCFEVLNPYFDAMIEISFDMK